MIGPGAPGSMNFSSPFSSCLAYAITWTAQIVTYVYAEAQGIRISNEDNLLHFHDLLTGRLETGFVPYLVLFHFAFGPTVAGIVVTAVFKGRAGLRDLLRRITKVRIPVRWVLTILAIPLAWSTLALAFGYVAGGFAPITYDFLVPVSMMVPFFLYLVVFTGISEEIGWRGYALLEIQSAYSAEKSSWILGVLWGCGISRRCCSSPYSVVRRHDCSSRPHCSVSHSA